MSDEVTDQENPQENPQQEQGLTFDGWVKSQPADVQKLLESHTSGLKNALTNERDQRKALAKQLKDLSGQLQEGDKARQSLEQITSQLNEQSQKVAFYEVVAEQVTNTKLAWLAARELGAIANDGTVNLELLKKNYPELFNKKPQLPPAKGGNGQGGSGAKPGMNDFIRQSAGRK